MAVQFVGPPVDAVGDVLQRGAMAEEPPPKRVKTEVEGGPGGGAGSSSAKMSSKEMEQILLRECKKQKQWIAPPVCLPMSACK